MPASLGPLCLRLLTIAQAAAFDYCTCRIALQSTREPLPAEVTTATQSLQDFALTLKNSKDFLFGDIHKALWAIGATSEPMGLLYGGRHRKCLLPVGAELVVHTDASPALFLPAWHGLCRLVEGHARP